MGDGRASERQENGQPVAQCNFGCLVFFFAAGFAMVALEWIFWAVGASPDSPETPVVQMMVLSTLVALICVLAACLATRCWLARTLLVAGVAFTIALVAGIVVAGTGAGLVFMPALTGLLVLGFLLVLAM
jgi:hypothetical protein